MSFQQIAKYLLVALWWGAAASCTDWVKDDLDDCPTGCYVQFSVADELQKVGKTGTDGFAGEVEHISLFVFDDNDRYVETRVLTNAPAADYRLTLDDMEPGTYHFVAWTGLTDANYRLPALTKGTTTLQELVLTLERAADNTQNNYLIPLWHGQTASVQILQHEMTEIKVGMLKNNNTFVTILQDTSGNPIEGDTYSYEIVADNGRMAHDNTVLPDDHLSYGAYHVQTATVDAATDAETRAEVSVSVARAELNTLRLMTDRPARFVVTERATGKQILNINLTQYLLLTREQYEGKIGQKLTDQEYLDYEDHYSIVFFLSPTGQVENPYLCLTLKINGWIVRLNEDIIL